MGVRGELFSKRISFDGRTYFFNVKENRTGDLFLTVVESKPTETGDFDRRSVVIFQENADAFSKVLQESLDAMREAAPSDRTKPPRTRRDAMAPRDDGRETETRLSDDERPRHYIDTGRPRDRDSGSARPASKAGARDSRPSRDAGTSHDDARRASVRRDVDKATGRTARGPNDDRRASPERKAPGTGRVIRVKSKAAPKMVAAVVEKPRAKRMTVKKVTPKNDD
jgi:hypothetical protein